MHLPIFVKKCTDRAKFEHVLKTFSSMTKTALCSIENLEEYESQNEKYTKISLAILSRKRKEYVREIEQGISVTGYILSEKEFYILMTADITVPSQNKVLIECMGFTRPETMHMFKVENLPHMDMVNYYKDTIPEEANFTEAKLPDKVERGTERVVDTYYFSEDLKSAVKSYLARPTKSLKTLVTLVWGRLFCDYLKTDYIFIKSLHEGGRLVASPIVCNNTLDNVEAYKSILSQYQTAEKLDNYGLDSIESVTGYDFEKYAPMVLDYVSDNMYVNFLEKMDTDIIYEIRAKGRETNPLIISCDLMGDEMSVTYDYCPDSFAEFEDFDVYNIHNMFMRTTEQIIFGEERTAKTAVGAGYSAERIREIKRNVIGKIDLFSGYVDPEEIKALVDKVAIIHRNMQDELCSSGQIVSGIFIPLTGKIEICAKDDQMIYNPLMILKEGKLFGAEIIKTDRRAVATYRIASNDSLLMYIKTDVLLEEAKNHPELITSLVDSICERLDRFQKLWIINS